MGIFVNDSTVNRDNQKTAAQNEEGYKKKDVNTNKTSSMTASLTVCSSAGIYSISG